MDLMKLMAVDLIRDNILQKLNASAGINFLAACGNNEIGRIVKRSDLMTKWLFYYECNGLCEKPKVSWV